MTTSGKIMLSLLGGALAASIVCNVFQFSKKSQDEKPVAENVSALKESVFQPSSVNVDLETRQFHVHFPVGLADPGDALSSLISVTPEPADGVVVKQVNPRQITLSGKFEMGTAYQVEVKPGLLPRYPVDNEAGVRWLVYDKPIVFNVEYSPAQEEKDDQADTNYPEREYLPVKYTTDLEYSNKYVSIYFESRIHSKLNLKDIIRITPELDFDPCISPYYDSVLRIYADFKPDTMYKIVLKPRMQPARMTDRTNRTKWCIAKKPFTISFCTPKETPSMSLVRSKLIYPLNSPVYELPVSVTKTDGTIRVSVRKVLPERCADFLYDETFYRPLSPAYSVPVSKGEYPIAKSDATGNMIVGADFEKMGIPRKAGIYEIALEMYDREKKQIGGTERKIFFLTDLMPMMTRSRGDCNFAVLSLADSKPVAGAKVKLYSDKSLLLMTLTTDANGLASVSETDIRKKMTCDEEQLSFVIFEHNDDMTYLSADNYTKPHDKDPAKIGDYAFVTSERDLYKPGEKAACFAFLRDSTGRKAKAGVPVSWDIQYPNGATFRKVNGVTDSNGFCRINLDIPADAPTGVYSAYLCEGGGKAYYGSEHFVVAEFTPDTLTMSAENKLEGDVLKNTGTAKYYFGTPVVNGNVTGTISAEWMPFQSKNFKDYEFIAVKDLEENTPYDRSIYSRIKTVTDSNGNYSVETGIEPVENAVMPIRFTSRVTVSGAASRSISASPSAQIKHFADHYIGVKLESAEESAVHFSIKAVTPDDKEVKTVTGLTAELVRVSWRYVRKIDGNYAQYVWQQELNPVSSTAVADGRVSFRNLHSGDYRVVIRNAESTVQNVYRFWFAGGETGERTNDPCRLYFTLDREKYLPGETASVTFESTVTGTGFVFAGDADIHTKLSFDVKKGKNTVQIPVPATHCSGDYHANFTVIGKQDEKDLNVHYQEGIASLKVDQLARKLAIEIQIPEKVRPAETVSVKLQLKNAKDQTPASGLVQLWAVDTGVLALSGFKTPDPFKFFFGYYGVPFYSDSNLSNLNYVETFKEKLIGGGAPGAAVLSKFLSDSSESAKPTAAFLLDAVNIPASGEATVSVKLPEHTGELTVMAIAANQEKVGNGEGKIIMRDSVSVQYTVPRVLAPEDEFSFTFEAFNNDLPDGEATWKITDLKGLVTVNNTSPEGKFKLAKGASHIVSGLTFKVAPDAESCAFRLALTLNGKTVTEDCRVTVRSALPKQTFVTTKLLKKGESVTISLDKRKDMLEIGTPAIMISGALDFLKEYPYGCTEQITAGAFPYLAVKPLVESGILDPFFGESAESIITKTVNDLELRRVSGAWYSMWREVHDVWEDGSFFVWHFLMEAASAGCPVDEKVRTAIDSCAGNFIQQRSRDVADRAYVTYILSLLRGAKAARYAQVMLSNDMEKMDNYSRFLLAAAMIRGGMAADGMVELRKALNTGFCEAASGVKTINSIERRLGLALWILADILPADDPALLSLVNRINSLIREDGHWGSTQANAWCALGLARYNARFGSGAKTDATVRMGDKTVPLTKVVRIDNVTDSVTVTNNGDAPVYIRHSEYRQPEKFVPVSNVLKIRREYLNADGKVVTKAAKGELLTVKVQITCPADTGILENLVLVDLLPGGLEIEDASFKTRFNVRRNQKGNVFGNCTERRFDRVVVFGDMYYDKYEVVYHVRAVHSGKFVIPPVQIESMYSPALRAMDRSADVFEVE